MEINKIKFTYHGQLHLNFYSLFAFGGRPRPLLAFGAAAEAAAAAGAAFWAPGFFGGRPRPFLGPSATAAAGDDASSVLAFFGGLALATGDGASSAARFLGDLGEAAATTSAFFFFSESAFGGRPRFLGSLGAIVVQGSVTRGGECSCRRSYVTFQWRMGWLGVE